LRWGWGGGGWGSEQYCLTGGVFLTKLFTDAGI